jgi:hypothetical protein
MPQQLLRTTFVLLACTSGCIGMSAPTATTSSGILGDLEQDTNRLGNDYRAFDLATADPELCQAECDKDARCKAFTYVKPGWQGASARCWLKDPVPPPGKHDCCVSGVKTAPP